MSVKNCAVLLLILSVSLINAQRSPYAGFRSSAGFENSGNRVDVPSTSNYNQRVPLDARNDVPLYNQLLTLPLEQQPFWLLNYQHIEQHRQQPNFQSSGISSGSHYAGR